MATSSIDISESSDIIHEFQCKPCADDDKNIEGVNFCAECHTYFCQACVQFHNKCFKTHTIFNKSGVKSGKLQFEQQQGELECEKHAGYLIQLYCGEHDVVCCAVCIAVDHRLCKNADFIPKLAKEVLNGRDKNDVKTSLEGLRNQLISMKAEKLKQIKDVGKEKDKNLQDIVKMKVQIIAKVEEMERNSVQQVQNKHDKLVKAIKSDIENIDMNINSVESNIVKVSTFKGNNAAKFFVVLNKAHEVEESSSGFIDENGNKEYDKIEFKINQDIVTFIGKEDAFGNVKGDCDMVIGNTVAMYSDKPGASIVKQIPIKGSDICMLDNGQIIIVSHGLKRLGKAFELLDECCVEAENICKVGPTEIAVLNENQISFVDAGKSLVVIRSFLCNDDIRRICSIKCDTRILYLNFRGISVSSGKMYVSFLVGYDKRYSDSCTYNLGVSIFDLQGCHIETLILSNDQSKIVINNATFSSYDACMYFSTEKKGIMVFDTMNKKLSYVTHKRLHNAFYVCEGRDGQYFVCGKDSHNIFLVDRKNNTMEEILGSIDGVRDPISVMYLKQENHLLVTSATQDVKVFQL